MVTRAVEVLSHEFVSVLPVVLVLIEPEVTVIVDHVTYHVPCVSIAPRLLMIWESVPVVTVAVIMIDQV